MFKDLVFNKIDENQDRLKAVDLRNMIGKPVTARLIGVHHIPNKFNVAVPRCIWTFLDENDVPFIIFGTSRLNRLLEFVPSCAIVRITYIGRSTDNKTGTTAHNYTVNVAETIPELSAQAKKFVNQYKTRHAQKSAAAEGPLNPPPQGLTQYYDDGVEASEDIGF